MNKRREKLYYGAVCPIMRVPWKAAPAVRVWLSAPDWVQEAAEPEDLSCCGPLQRRYLRALDRLWRKLFDIFIGG